LFELAPARSYARFRDFLHEKQQRGEVDVPDVQIAAEQFLAGLVGHQQLRMLLGVGTPSRREIDDRVDAAVRMFVRTYARPDADP
jgi:TetR/AcrR family transcriptional repressor of mexJK operon